MEGILGRVDTHDDCDRLDYYYQYYKISLHLLSNKLARDCLKGEHNAGIRHGAGYGQ